MNSENLLEDKIARLKAELQAERAMGDVSDRISRLEEQLKAAEKAMKDGLDSAKSLAIRAYATISIVFGLLGFIGWTTINSAINSRVEDEFKKGGFDRRIEEEVTKVESKIQGLSEEVEILSSEAKSIIAKFKVSTEKRLQLVRNYTTEKLSQNPDLATSTGARLAGLKLTPTFGITPSVTTRKEIEELIKAGKLKSFGTIQKNEGSKIEFAYAVISFQEKKLELTRNPYDTIISLEYWGDEPLPLGLTTLLALEQAKRIAEENFVWLGYQDFRGLVFSNKKDGPILLEISSRGGRKNPLTYTIYGPL